MSDSFITKIQVNDVRNLTPLEIPLSDERRNHLIITGKNGSGKTTLLLAIKAFMEKVSTGQLWAFAQAKQEISVHTRSLVELKQSVRDQAATEQIINTENALGQWKQHLAEFGGVELEFRNRSELLDRYIVRSFIFTFFDAKRAAQTVVPRGIEKVELKSQYNSTDRSAQQFLQYIVNMKAERSFARDDGDEQTVSQIDAWFEGFEQQLKTIFDAPDLQLEFDRKNFTFRLIEEGKAAYRFDQLSDGYSAILSVVMELMMRMEGLGKRQYDAEGVVLIDEIETHLHVDLQKKILPFLTNFFPKIQFIVSTHSPFVLSSLEEAVICDLEHQLVTEDLSAYSYDAIVESYFEVDKYSTIIKEKVARYELLSAKESLPPAKKDELRQLRDYLSHAPKYLSEELRLKLQQLELDSIATVRH